MKKLSEKTLTFEQVEPHLHKWAYILSHGKCDVWELINSAWAYGKVRLFNQSQIRFASRRIHQDMIDYIRSTTGYRKNSYHRRRGNRYPTVRNFSAYDNGSVRNFSAYDNGSEGNADKRELVEFITNQPCLSRTEKLLTKLIYVGGYNMREAGKVCGLSGSRVSQIMANVIERLRAVDYSRAI